MKRKNIDDNDNNFNKNDDKNTIRKKKKVKYNFDITSIVPDKTSLFESAVLDWLKKNLHNSSVNNQKSKSKKYIYDRHQIYKACVELKDKYNIKNLKFSNDWIISFQNRHHLLKPVTKNKDIKNKTDTSSSTTTSSSDNVIQDNVIQHTNTYRNQNAFESAVLMKLKNILPSNLPNSMYSYEHGLIKAICLELKDQFKVSRKFSNTWTSSFQLRHQLIQLIPPPTTDNTCRFCHKYLSSLSKKLKSIEEHEAICRRKPKKFAIIIKNNDNVDNNNDTIDKDSYNDSNSNDTNKNDNNDDNNNDDISITINPNGNNNNDNNNNNNTCNTTTIPSLTELFLLKKFKSEQKSIVDHNDENETNYSKLIKDWNKLNNDDKSKISLKIRNGNHIRNKTLLNFKDKNSNNDKKIKYELNINDNNRKNDYIPKSDDECEVNSIIIDGGKNHRNNFKGNIERQKKIVKKILNSMSLIPNDDEFILNNLNEGNVNEANKNVEMIKSKLNDFLNM